MSSHDSSSGSQALGDHIARALATVGLTTGRIEGWLGGPCGCKERQDKINAIDAWSRRVISGKVTRAKEYLEQLML